MRCTHLRILYSTTYAGIGLLYMMCEEYAYYTHSSFRMAHTQRHTQTLGAKCRSQMFAYSTRPNIANWPAPNSGFIDGEGAYVRTFCASPPPTNTTLPSIVENRNMPSQTQTHICASIVVEHACYYKLRTIKGRHHCRCCRQRRQTSPRTRARCVGRRPNPCVV